MDPLQTAATYDRIAPHWEDPNFDRNNGIEALRRAIRFAHGRGAALDIGCGCTGRFIDLLLAEGFDVEGLDLSAEMLARARNRHPDVRFHHADIRTWEFSRPYDLLIGWDSIWHVPLADQIPVLRRLCRGLAPGGLLLLSAGGLDHPHEVTNPCHGEPLYHATVGIPRLLRTLGAAGCVLRHLEFDQHPSSHLSLLAEKVERPSRSAKTD